MATINNADLTKELIDGAKIQLSRDRVPGVLGQTVVPTLEVNPKMFRIANVSETSGALNNNSTIYATPSNKDFFLTSCVMSRTKDVTSDESISFLGCTINGKSVTLIRMGGVTLNAQVNDIVLNLTIPVKVDRGTNITLTKTSTTVGNSYLAGSIIGYTVED